MQGRSVPFSKQYINFILSKRQKFTYISVKKQFRKHVIFAFTTAQV